MQSNWLGFRRTAVIAGCLAVPAFAAAAAAQAPAVLPPPTAAPAPSPASVVPAGPSPGPTIVPLVGFGAPGQLVLTVDLDSLQLTILRASGSGSSATSVLIQPGLDYFISPDVSVGGLLSYAHGAVASIGDDTFGLQVRAGYNLQLNAAFSWWLRAGLGFFHGSDSLGHSGSTLPFQLFLPVLWHLVPHVFLGFGPTVTTDLVTSDSLTKQTYLGAQLVLGGTFGLR
jgi:hypothetical protein